MSGWRENQNITKKGRLVKRIKREVQSIQTNLYRPLKKRNL